MVTVVRTSLPSTFDVIVVGVVVMGMSMLVIFLIVSLSSLG